MSSKERKHEKHGKLARVSFGNAGRNEIAILGSPCDEISSHFNMLLKEFSSEYAIGILDSDHLAFKNDLTPIPLRYGAQKQILSKESFKEVSEKRSENAFDRYFANQELDVVLVNGNHFMASEQVVIADERKRDSLERHTERLTNVRVVFLPAETEDVPDWLSNLIPEDQQYEILSGTTALIEWFRSRLENIRPPLYGLVLTGGKSTRMGEDKSLLKYYDKPQYEHMAELISPFCDDVFLSARPQQKIATAFPLIRDRFRGLGPFGGILSAFMHDPEAAWLVMAVDLPLINADDIEHLVENRMISKLATAFHNPETDLPDPLCTIWEPKAYPRMLSFLSLGHSCPRKVLINSRIHEVEPLRPECLRNANTVEERDEIMKKLRSTAG